MQTLPQMVLGIIQWTIAILSILGTIALFTWIVVMFLKKDTTRDPAKNETNRDRS